jgi:hypothetical protein
MTTQLPECAWRLPLPNLEVFGCRHTAVRTPAQQVTTEVCAACRWRTVPCPHPHEAAAILAAARGPTWFATGWNLAQSLAEFVADGLAFVSSQTYEARLEVCDQCEQRIDTHCRICGCRLALKARGRAFQCPLGRWPDERASAEKELVPTGSQEANQ